MKKTLKLFVLAAAALCVLSCDDNENFKVSEGVMFDVTAMTNNATYVKVENGTYSVALLKTGKGETAGTATVTFAPEILAAYNAAHGTEYVALEPSDVILSTDVVSFEAADTRKTLSIAWDGESLAKKLNESIETKYVVPLKITASSLRIADGGDYVLVQILLEEPLIPEDVLLLQRVKKEGEVIFGNGNGFDGKWKILKNEDYCILLDKEFSLPASPYNLFDGDLVSKNGTWFSKFDSQNDDPVVFELDLQVPIAPCKFYFQHFTDTQNHKKFDIYLAKEYKGEDTEWTLVCSANGVQNYMVKPDYDFQDEFVCNANGPTENKCYNLTYAVECSTTMFARYMRIELPLPDATDNPLGKGKVNEIYMKGLYENPEDKPAPLEIITGPWEVIEGEDLGAGRGKDSGCENAGWFAEQYPVGNLVDGIYGLRPEGMAWYTGAWYSWISVQNEFPMVFVFDMGESYTPCIMHVVDSKSHQGQYRNFDFYVTDEYNAENPADVEWTLICEGRRSTWAWGEFAGNDYTYPVTNPASGRYLKFVILDAANHDGDYINDRGYLDEVYFEGHK